MSPSAAIHSPVFLLYLALAGGLLSTAGIVLALLKRCFRLSLGHATTAYRGWLLMIPPLLLVFFLGREAVVVFVTFVAALGFREYARASDLGRDRVLSGAVYLGICTTGIVSLAWPGVRGGTGGYDAFMALPVFVTAAILVIPVIRDRAREQLRLSALAILGFVFLGWMFGHLALLANSTGGYAYLGYLVAAVALNDVAAYTFGKLFGRHSLRTNISPKKTLEGAAGALAVSLLLPWVLRPTLPHFQAMDCLLAGLIVGVVELHGVGLIGITGNGSSKA